MASNTQKKASELREQIAALQAELDETMKKERADVLSRMREDQARYRFTARELGNHFKHRPRGRGGE